MPIVISRRGTTVHLPQLSAEERERAAAEVLRAFIRAHPEAVPAPENTEKGRDAACTK